MAQILPVLGLAHVLETRQMIRTDAAAYPAWYRTVIGVWHFLCLAALGVSLLCCIDLMRPGSAATSTITEGLLSVAVPASVATLILNPAWNALFLAAAAPASKVSWQYVKMRLRIYRLNRDINGLLKVNTKQDSRIRKMKEELAEQNGKIETVVLDKERAAELLSDMDTNDERRRPIEGLLAELEVWLRSADTYLPEMEERLAEALLKEADAVARIRQIRDDVNTVRSDLEKAWAAEKNNREGFLLKLAGMEQVLNDQAEAVARITPEEVGSSNDPGESERVPDRGGVDKCSEPS